MTNQRHMLIACRDQFAMYAQNHRAKVNRWQARIDELAPVFEQYDEVLSLKDQIANALCKAEANEQFALNIQAVLNESENDVLQATADFARIAYDDGITDKNRQTQIGVHFEEVAEMIAEIGATDLPTIEYINAAQTAMTALAVHLKNSVPLIFIKDRLSFLDACCDQLVTVTLSAVLADMDPVGGLREVNRSNYSKLVNGKMQKVPVTLKWVKGPNYSKPDLTPFI